MNWQKRLSNDERVLKSLIDRLGDAQLAEAPDELAQVRQALTDKLSQMRAFTEDCLSGRTDEEKSVLLYRLRVEYPLFAHLVSLSSLSREYVEWSTELPVYTVGAGRGT